MRKIIPKENVGRYPSVTAISVWERMDLHHPVMEAGSGFPWRKNRVLSPIASIIEENPNLNGDLKRVNADIFLGQTINSRPYPNAAKQPLMQYPYKIVRQNVARSPSSDPSKTGRDIAAFELIELKTSRDVLEFQSLDVVSVKRCRSLRLLKHQSAAQRSDGLFSAISLARLSISSLRKSSGRACFSNAI